MGYPFPERESLKRRIVEVAYRAQEGHVPSALSILDIVWTLYSKTMGPNDKFVLSKGHGCLAQYAVLDKVREGGTFHYLDAFGRGQLCGHPERNFLLGIEATTGSLGHGFPMSAGMALAKKIKQEQGTIFCIVGDTEMEEGSCAEAMLLAGRLQLSNLVVIVDCNGTSPNKIDGPRYVGSLADKFLAYGWFVMRSNGHDVEMLERLLTPAGGVSPVCLVADTVKGKGISFMEREPQMWHHKLISPAELAECLA